MHQINKIYDYYVNLNATNNGSILKYKKGLQAFQLARFLTILFTVFLILYFSKDKSYWIFGSVLFLEIIAFSILSKKINLLQEKHNYHLKKAQILDNEIHIISHKKIQNNHGRRIEPDKHHPYSKDLNIIGESSIFSLIDRTNTDKGQEILTSWMSNLSERQEIVARQHAVKELTPLNDWRLHFQISGRRIGEQNPSDESNISNFTNWVKDGENKIISNQVSTIRIYITRIITFISITFFLININSFWIKLMEGQTGWSFYILPFLLSAIINIITFRKYNKQADKIINHTQKLEEQLLLYGHLANLVNTNEYTTPLLSELKNKLNLGDTNASKEINALVKLLEVFHLRGKSNQLSGASMIYSMLNSVAIIDHYYISELSKWQTQNKNKIETWIDSISYIEALVSLSGFSYNNPSYHFPEISNKFKGFNFKNLGHPLMDERKMIRNDIQLTRKGEIIIITGSNMAGKSTFLKSIGTNVVLAYAGAPVFAESAEISIMQLFTSLNVADSLKDGLSSFYAELSRIQKLIALINDEIPVLFLLDELLKGTNSEDSFLGAKGLISQFENNNCLGIISSHEMRLADLASTSDKIMNFHFSSELSDGHLTYDHILKKGNCRDTNAVTLMMELGLYK